MGRGAGSIAGRAAPMVNSWRAIMKTSTAVIGVFLAGCLLATGCVHHHHHSQPVVVEPETPVGGPVGADPVVDMFYNDLAPYGEWVYIDGPGWVWSPYDVAADWRPYQYGHWAYTDYGWTWASDEDYGWAVYHYGRWHQSPRHGWVWVPGSEWGPAWVAWQESDAWVGWAPLPYHVGWRVGVGLDWGHSNVHVSIQSGHWSFVATRHMVEPQVHRHVVPRSRNTNYINVTKHVTNYTYIDNRVINNSVRVKNVGRAVGHPVRKHHVRRADKPGRTRGGRDDDDDLVIYRPREHPGREPQRRPVPPGHDDEHQGKKDRQGQANSRGQKNGHGKNDRDERPAANHPDRGQKPKESRATQPATRPQRHRPEQDRHEAGNPDRGNSNNGRKPRPAELDEREHQNNGGQKGRTHRNDPKDRQQAAPADQSRERDSKKQLQAAPRSTREPQPDSRPAASDYRRSGSKKAQPAASQPSRSKGKAATDKNSKGSDSKSNKSGSSDTKGGKSKGDKSKDGDAKGEKSKQPDSEEEEQDSGKKNSKKRD